MSNYILVKCGACGSEVSNGAVSCPRCGHAPGMSEGKTCRDCVYSGSRNCNIFHPEDKRACPGFRDSWR